MFYYLTELVLFSYLRSTGYLQLNNPLPKMSHFSACSGFIKFSNARSVYPSDFIQTGGKLRLMSSQRVALNTFFQSIKKTILNTHEMLMKFGATLPRSLKEKKKLKIYLAQ